VAGAIDGQGALRHASALAALGPHPYGSPRSQAAAAYVAAQFREVGLDEVRLQNFESGGQRGSNALGVLRASGPEFIVLGAHHDSVAVAPGAYDDGGGVGVLIEVARLMVQESRRTRTVVFASWDGEEVGLHGSREYIRSLAGGAQQLAAALVVEMSGWSAGSPSLHPIAYADPRRPGGQVIAPAWLVRVALQGSRRAGQELNVGDPLIPWLYQPAVRLFRVGFSGDDQAFLRQGLPAVFVSDSSFSRFYPHYHSARDTPDRLDGAALERMGAAVRGVLDELGQAPRGPADERAWFAAFGQVWGAGWLYLLGALSLLPGLWLFRGRGALGFGVRALQAGAYALLLWRQPVPALFLLLLPNLITAFATGALATFVALVPALLLGGLGVMAWNQGMVRGLWLGPWELGLLALAFALLWVQPGRTRASGAPRGRRAGATSRKATASKRGR
jgi:hypothetical protein